MEPRSHSRLVAAPLIFVTLLFGVFHALPLLIIVTFSFLTPSTYGGVEWRFYHWNYGRILGWADGKVETFETVYLQVLARSCGVAVVTVILTLVLCYPVALWVRGLSRRARLLVLFTVMLPFFSSMIVRLYAWLLILKPLGPLNAALGAIGLIQSPIEILYTQTAVVLGMTYLMLPYMFLPLFASVDNLERAQIEASMNLGASRSQTFAKIILPQTFRGILSGSVLVFVPTLGNCVVPSVLGGAKGVMIGNLVEQQFLAARNWPFGAALSVVMVALIIVAILICIRLANGVRT